MPSTELPTGRYLSCPIDLSPDAGGQTRAMLMRNRIFVTEGGVKPVVATFNARTDLPERRAMLLERGLLLPEISTPNIYEHYRNNPWEDEEPGGEQLPDLSAHTATQEFFPDGTPFRTVYRSDPSKGSVFDYHRADGSTYLRLPSFVFKEPETWPSSIQRVGPDGAVLGEFKSVGQWFKRFVRHLSGDERTFVFVDSRFSVQHLVPMRAKNVHVVYVLHNIHVAPPRLWSSELSDIYGRLVGKVDDVDAFVTLTARQQDDIAQRRGRTTNLFVVPNPVDMPDRAPDLPPRDPHRVTVVARLEKQKRLGHAIRAFALAAQRVPEARLDIYGAGSQLSVLEQVAAKHGVSDSVTLHGHDPRARDALWSSSAFLMTSLFEGYPLSTLESLSHGCPVISYDIKYGPREQISEGVDGFLVPAGGVRQMADRIVTMLTSPELVARMSEAAREKARHHGHGRFLDEWRQVLEQVVELAPLRTHLEDVRLDVTRLETAEPGLRGRLSRRPLPAHATRDAVLRFAGELHVTGRSKQSSLDDAEITLTAVHAASGYSVDLPVTATRSADGFTVSAEVPLKDAFGDERLDDVRLRLRLVWQNSSWETQLSRPAGDDDGVEVGYTADGAVRLSLR
ncbi:glycosyltransferase [Nocardioides panacis]|uniref:Glycosyltransferase n=1 Tax=Nocardioides panacis TaxID=2849501 RepID=A0A975XZG5_9ACTN|nr:glycosyltransferase [Nocardioides panacis]QWZ07234.1 glycosyltransferase [Nocardioides panacis]